MVQAGDREKSIVEKVRSLAPEQQQAVLEFVEFLEYKAGQQANGGEQSQQRSFLEAAQEFIGCVDGGPGDLATNKQHMQGFGEA